MRTTTKCPHFEETSIGTTCSVADCFIKNIEGADIRLCMDRRFEACYVYFIKLRMMAISKQPVADISLGDSRPHAFGSL